MTRYRIICAPAAIGAIIFAPVAMAQQQSAPSGPSRPGDLELSCPALAMEMAKSAQLLAQTPAATAPAAAGQQPVVVPAALAGLASQIGTDKLVQAGQALQQQQNAQQLANLQMLAARGGVNKGAATAAIGGLAALQNVAANGGNVREAAGSVAADAVGNQLASRIPGGKMLGGMMGGLFKKKPKPVPVADTSGTTAENADARARLTFLTSMMQAKGCQ